MHITYEHTRRPGDMTESLLKGRCTEEDRRTLSLRELMGLELMAILNSNEKKKKLMQEAFMFFASAGNGTAALEAVKAVQALMVPFDKLCPIDTQLGYDQFKQEERTQRAAFFDWLVSRYWELPLYVPNPWVTSLRGEGMEYKNPLEKLKEWVIGEAVSEWIHRNHASDGSSLPAFDFLCDHYDQGRFFTRAQNVRSEVQRCISEFHLSGHISQYLRVETYDQKLVLDRMRKALEHAKLETIVFWIEQSSSAPEKIRKLLGHAYVNHDGNVLSGIK